MADDSPSTESRPEVAAGAAAQPAAPRVIGFSSMPMPSAPFWWALLAGIVAVTVIVIAGHALLVFAIGVALSFFLVPVVNWLERHGLGRITASILAVATVVIVTVVVVVGALMILFEQGVAFVKALPAYLDELGEQIAAMGLPTWLQDAIDSAAASAQQAVANVEPGTVLVGIAQGVLGIAGSLFAFLILPFFTFYLVKDQPRMSETFYRGVPAPWKGDVSRVITIFVSDFAHYFKGELIVGGIMAVIVFIGMQVFGRFFDGGEVLLTFALLLALIAMVMELLPQIGPIISYIPAAILAATVSLPCLAAVSVFYFVIFNIEGSILVPTFEGKMISFSGASVLFLIAIGFAVGGIVGAIVALPIAAIARDVFVHFFLKSQAASAVLAPAPATTPDTATPTGGASQA